MKSTHRKPRSRDSSVKAEGVARQSGSGERQKAIWWLHPRVPVLLLGVPLLVISYFVSASVYLFLYNTPKYIDVNFVIAGLFVYAGLVVGTFFSVNMGRRPETNEIFRYCRIFVWPLFLLTVFGYAAWLSYAVVRAGLGTVVSTLGEMVINPSPGLSDYIKYELLQTIPGVTTLTQLGILYVTVEAILWIRGRERTRAALIRFSVIGALTLSRAILYSERLSLIEIILPVLVIAVSSIRGDGIRRKMAQTLPLFGGIGVVLLFAVAEYFRSWSFYKNVYVGPYAEFALQRFLGYYTTATNNAAVYYYFMPSQPFKHSFNSLFELPGVGVALGNLHTAIFGSDGLPDGYTYEYVLERYATPEFNNVPITGLLPNEFSVYLAPLAALLLGVIVISIYRSFEANRLIGTLLYPSWFIGMLELPRLYYWSDQRYFPVLAFLALSLIVFKLAYTPARSSKSAKSQPNSPYSAGRGRL